MGHSNGQHDKPSTTGKGETVQKGIGFKLTPDNHFHLQNKRITNIPLQWMTMTQPLKNSSLIY